MKLLQYQIVLLILSLIISNHAYDVHDFIYNPKVPGAILNLPIQEPSSLPLVDSPCNGIILPMSAEFGFSNSEFTLYSPLTFFVYRKNMGTLLSHLLMSSFDIEGLPPSQVSSTLTDRLKNGAEFTFNANYTYFQLAQIMKKQTPGYGISFRLESNSSASLYMPGGIFALLFSDSNGLQKGNQVSLNSLETELDVITDFSVSYGRKFPSSLSFFNRTFDLSWGVSGTYKIGHMMFNIETDSAIIDYSEDNIMSINANFDIKSAGINLNDQLQFVSTIRDKGIINGHGAGITSGITVSTERLFLTMSLNNLGFMSWKSDGYNNNIQISDDSLYLVDFKNGTSDLISVRPDKNSDILFNSLPTSLSLKASMLRKLKMVNSYPLKMVASSQAFSLGVIQPFFKDYLNKRIPHIFLSLENVMVDGHIPIRIGWDFHSKQQYSSFLEVEQVGKGVTLSLWYRAKNDMLFRSIKGGEVGVQTRVFW